VSRASIGRRAVSVALSSMLLMSLMVIPLTSVAVAASEETMCEGSEGFFTCWLDIRSPSSVVAGTTFTVQVAVTTDETMSTVAKSDPCGSKAEITLDIFGPDESFGSMTTNASAGIASFSLNLSTPGEYELFASGPGEVSVASTVDCDNYFYVGDEFGPLTVVNIPANAAIAPCPPDTSCVQTTSGSGTQATLIASEGSDWSPKGADYFGQPIVGAQCGTTTPNDPNGILGYELATFDGTRTGVIILALDPRDKGVGQFNLCWTQTVPFTPLGGGAPVLTGDLPNCRQRDQVAPCVVARTAGQGGNVAFLTILGTANLIDPKVYAH
jgi:hypothetical protein